MGEPQDYNLAPLTREHLVKLNEFKYRLSSIDRDRFRFLDETNIEHLTSDPIRCFVFLTQHITPKVVAFGHLTRFTSDAKRHVARLGVAVDPMHRDLGLGRRMVNKLLAEAERAGIKKVWLSVRSDNRQAISLYDKMGFQLEGVFRDEERDGATSFDIYSMGIALPRDDKYVLPWCEPDWGVHGQAEMIKTISGGWMTQGSKVREFEKLIAEISGTEDAVVVNSGTSALLLCALFLREEWGYENFYAPSLSFAATAAPFKLAGYKGTYVDVEPDTALINMWAAEQVEHNHPDEKIPVVVHLGGARVPTAWIEKRKTPVVIDAAQAFGQAEIPDNTLGIYSFHAAKVTTTVEGGAVVGKAKWMHKIRALREHGALEGAFMYEAHHPGLNMRMTDIQAALGIAQMVGHEKRMRQRQRVYNWYKNLLPESVKLQTMTVGSMPTLVMARFTSEAHKEAAQEALREANIHTRPVWPPLPTQFGNRPDGGFVVAADWHLKGLLLPMSSRMVEGEVTFAVDVISKSIKNVFAH